MSEVPTPPPAGSVPPPPIPGQPAAPQQPGYAQPAQQQPVYGQQAGYGRPVYSQPGYAQPGYPQAPAYYAPPARTNTLAIVALVLSFFVTLGGIICGHIALAQIKRTGEGGRGLALAGLIIGYALSAFWVVYFTFVIVFILAGAAGAFASYNY